MAEPTMQHPVPARYPGTNQPRQFSLHTLQIGDSVDVPVDKYQSFSAAVHVMRHDVPDWCYAIEKQGDIYRVTRIAEKPASRYRWHLMQPGSSVDEPIENFNRARGSAAAYKRAHPGWNYLSVREGDVIRFWRTA